MGLDNIIAGDGIGIAITGMLIVVTGLVFISLYIAAIPRALRKLQEVREAWAARQAAPTEAAAFEAPEDDPAFLAAVAYVLQQELELEQAVDQQQITMQRAEASRVWAYAGKMRTLSTRLESL